MEETDDWFYSYDIISQLLVKHLVIFEKKKILINFNKKNLFFLGETACKPSMSDANDVKPWSTAEPVDDIEPEGLRGECSYIGGHTSARTRTSQCSQ